MNNLREEFYNGTKDIIKDYIDEIESLLNDCISNLESVDSLEDLPEVIEQFKKLANNLY